MQIIDDNTSYIIFVCIDLSIENSEKIKRADANFCLSIGYENSTRGCLRTRGGFSVVSANADA